MTNVSISERWEVRYRGCEVPKQFDWFAWQEVQKFAKEVDVESITFSATGIFEPPDGKPYTREVYSETLTTDDLSGLSRAWIEERLQRIKAEIERAN